jgi:hypothetical protein
MSDFQRGTVKAISVEMEYPDGSIKKARIADAADVQSIVFDEGHLRSPDDGPLFNVSASDWRENPAMLVYRRRAPGKEALCTAVCGA